MLCYCLCRVLVVVSIEGSVSGFVYAQHDQTVSLRSVGILCLSGILMAIWLHCEQDIKTDHWAWAKQLSIVNLLACTPAS